MASLTPFQQAIKRLSDGDIDAARQALLAIWEGGGGDAGGGSGALGHLALQHLARLPDEQFRVDTAVAIFEAIQRDATPELNSTWQRTLRLARRDSDHPMHGLWSHDATINLEKIRERAPLPAAGDPRSIYRGMDRVMAEAVVCEPGTLPSEVPTFLESQLVDEGGYLTTHAIWTVQRLQTRACLTEAQTSGLLGPHRQRLLAALSAPHEPSTPLTTAEADLLAEQLAMACTIAVSSETIAGPFQRLLNAQRADGGFGTATPGQNPRLEVHATAVAIWALSACAPDDVSAASAVTPPATSPEAAVAP